MNLDDFDEAFGEEIYLTSRSRAPSIIDITSQHEGAFAELPDLIQEAAVSTEFGNPRLRVNRVHSGSISSLDTTFMTSPMFYISSNTDSGIDMPDLTVKDEKYIGKYGIDLSANFADIRAHGPSAFVQRVNLSNNSTYSLCTCATGYIWVRVELIRESLDPEAFSDVEVQIGTFALKAHAITTSEIQARYMYSGRDDPLDGQLSLLCSTVLGNYLRNRMMGEQYEEATENAIRISRQRLSPLKIADPGRFDDFKGLLRRVCSSAPMPPISDVSQISRGMITRRWQCWDEGRVLRKTSRFAPARIVMCFRNSGYDSIDLLSGCSKGLGPRNKRQPRMSSLDT